jgi:hypothetical protein
LRVKERSSAIPPLPCGDWVVTSGTEVLADYAITLNDCERRAAQERDTVRRHRALLAIQVLSHDDPEPEPPAPAAVPQPLDMVPLTAERMPRHEAITILNGDVPADFEIAALSSGVQPSSATDSRPSGCLLGPWLVTMCVSDRWLTPNR